MSNQDEGCDGCSRRAVLQGLIAASALVPMGCDSDDPNNPGVDGQPGVDAPAGQGFEMCGANVCVDLTHPNNAPLATTGGSRLITAGTTRILIVRLSDTEFQTLSGRCTHAGFNVRYTAPNVPCTNTGGGHGSQFDIDGNVIRGPAVNPLTVFTNTFDMASSLLTIEL